MSEIKIQYGNLHKGISDIRTLANETSALNLQFDFSNSKGQMVDSLINIQNQINKVQMVLTDLYNNTADSLQKMADTFKDTDEELSNTYRGKTGSLVKAEEK